MSNISSNDDTPNFVATAETTAPNVFKHSVSADVVIAKGKPTNQEHSNRNRTYPNFQNETNAIQQYVEVSQQQQQQQPLNSELHNSGQTNSAVPANACNILNISFDENAYNAAGSVEHIRQASSQGGHRRARSGDAAIMRDQTMNFIRPGFYNMNANDSGIAYPSGILHSSSAYNLNQIPRYRFNRPEHPTRFQRPEHPTRFQGPEHPTRFQRPEHPTQFHQSVSMINTIPSYNQYVEPFPQDNPYSYILNQPHQEYPYFQNQSQDENHEHLKKQISNLITLQHAITENERIVEDLKNEVEEKERELNLRCRVSKNPTASEYRQLQAENKYLQNEIQEMFTEMDKLGIPFGDTPRPPISLDTPSRTPILLPMPKPAQTLPDDDNSLARPYFSPRQLPPPYSEVKDPPPSFKTLIKPSLPQHPRLPDIAHRPLPPIPTDVEPVGATACLPVSEEWICQKCTFENLLVAECELCFTPRTIKLQR